MHPRTPSGRCSPLQVTPQSGLPRRYGWRHDASLHPCPQIVADGPMLNDQAVAKSEALGVPEVHSAATGLGSGHPDRGDDLVAVREELLELGPEVGAYPASRAHSTTPATIAAATPVPRDAVRPTLRRDWRPARRSEPARPTPCPPTGRRPPRRSQRRRRCWLAAATRHPVRPLPRPGSHRTHRARRRARVVAGYGVWAIQPV